MTEHKEIFKARSTKNGIIFYSNLIPFCGTETFIDENGSICSQPISNPPGKKPDYQIPLDDKLYALRKKREIFLDFIILFFSFFLASTFGITGLPGAVIFFCLTTSSLFYTFVEYCHEGRIPDKNGYSLNRFHGAEHMAINAYNKLQRIPTLEEIRGFSRFLKNCGSRHLFKKLVPNLVLCILIAVFTFSSPTFWALFIGLVIPINIVIRLCIDEGWFRFLQVFITEKPSDNELLLAIEALKNFESMEEELEPMKPIVEFGICGGIVIIGLPEDY